ncbi:MAG: DUF1295 domain-containing protein [Bacteroidota bacterium]
MLLAFPNTLLLLFFYATLWFIIAQWRKNNSLADVAWGLGFVVLSLYLWGFDPGFQRGLLTSFVTIWGLRLSIHIFNRNMKKAEDWRYVNMRQKWGQRQYLMAYLQVFILQGTLLWIIAIPIFLPSPSDGYSLSIVQIIGTAFWLVGFLWESIADWQLYQFKKDGKNKGKLMTQGLWAYSRHPNYFGEIVLWWGIFLFVLPWENSWLAVLSPLMITFLLTRVSGVPMLEAKYKEHKAYKAYIASTNALIPKFR